MANTDGKRRAKKKDTQPFDPGAALEQLHTAVVRLEALSHAVINSLEFLPRVEGITERRALEHTCSLMVVLDAEIAKAVAAGDKMVKQLGEYLKTSYAAVRVLPVAVPQRAGRIGRW